MLRHQPASDFKKVDKDSALSASLKCAYELMTQRIISNPYDMMGILLFGTEQTKNGDGESEYPHSYLLVDLAVPSADDVKALKLLIDDKEEFEKLMVPSKEPVSLANVFFCANQIFAEKAANFTSKRLFIVTDNDDPHEKDKTTRSAATVRAKDLYDLGVIIELFPVARSGEDFDRTKFYNVTIGLLLVMDHILIF